VHGGAIVYIVQLGRLERLSASRRDGRLTGAS